MSEEYILKQIAILTEMFNEERLDIEKQIINDKLVELYRAKVNKEMLARIQD